MTRRWGHDQEERAACTKKAQDAYAIGRQAMEKISGLEAAVGALTAELDRVTAALQRLERRFEATTEPVARTPSKRIGSRQEIGHA
jgi:hypothetical protein